MPSRPSHKPPFPAGRRPPNPLGREETLGTRIHVTAPLDIALCVRARRHQLKLGQADLAAHIGVGRQWIVGFEAGKGSAELALVMKTVLALGLDLSVIDRDPPDWTVPLTAAAGTAARPYAKARRWRRRPHMA